MNIWTVLNWIIVFLGTILKQDQKNLVAKNAKETQIEITAKLLDPKMSGAILSSVNPYLKSQKGRITAVVAKARYPLATKNQAQQRIEHSARSRPSNTVIKVLVDSGLDGDLMFHDKGTPMHSPYLTRQVPNSWHTLNGNFLTKGRREVNLKRINW